jgi:uncharacterized membrane protein YeaQ/YmgE (transglycosylase-associated protein family)
MGIIAWIVLGLAAGFLANMLIPGKKSQGLIITCVIGIAGALLGGWAATRLFHIHTLHGFFNLSTWLTAIAGAAALLLAYHRGHRAVRQEGHVDRVAGFGDAAGPGLCCQLPFLAAVPDMTAGRPWPARTLMCLACTSSALGTRTCSTPSCAEASILSASTWLGRVIERRKAP